MAYHHGDLPAALLAAVREAITDNGVSGVSLRDVARRAGVSHSAPAHHFGSKAGLLMAFAAEGFRLLAQAMRSGQLAAEVLLSGPGRAAERYATALVSEHVPYQRITAALQAALVARPRAVAAVARFLTTAATGDALAGGWAVFWNELLEGAPPGRHRSVATALTRIGDTMTARTAVARWFERFM